MAKNKKPTMLQVVQVMNQVIQDIKSIETSLSSLGAAYDMYLDFKGDAKAFEKTINNKIKEASNDIQRNENVSKKPIKINSTN